MAGNTREKTGVRWYVYKRGTIHYARTFLYHESIRESCTDYFDIDDFRMVYLNIGDKLIWAWDHDQMDEIGRLILEILKDDKKKDEHFNLMQDIVKMSISASENIIFSDLKILTDDELVSSAYNLYEEIKPLHCYLGIIIDAVDLYPVEHLRDKILGLLHLESKEAYEVYEKLTAPLYVSYLKREDNILLDIASRAKKEGKDPKHFSDEIKKAVDLYWWTGFGWESMEKNTKESFLKAVKEYVLLYDPSSKIFTSKDIEKIRKKREELISRYSLQDVSYLIYAFDEYAKMHELRKEGQVKSVYAMHLIQEEIARRLNVSSEDMEWFSFREASDFLRSKAFDREMCELRKKATLEYVEGKKTFKLYGNDAISFGEREFGGDFSGIDEVSGTVSSTGHARGFAKVCKGAKEALEKVSSGDILICGMTLPDYVPAMKKALAVVTDEGGITCHAAIISRELNKPCITGTINATRVFKDGDLIEVDAINGIVRKIG